MLTCNRYRPGDWQAISKVETRLVFAEVTTFGKLIRINIK
ncbi:hypothetical protein GCM10011409_35240 [Lentibacillus populi]|uniref:Uncharacterized protein n=1 Tax=Lentibacillus populi TaxID=1827502 RepID=A0A9W5X6W5_9BACI|nr:hypothetical protein GCM10011409_35240 [Lentibacillus populi]